MTSRASRQGRLSGSSSVRIKIKARAGILIAFALLFLVLIPFLPTLLFTAAFAYTAWKDDTTFPQRVLSKIPEKIVTTSVFTDDYSPSFGGGGDCGSIAFKLSEKTLSDIKERGLSYFEDAAPQGETDYRGTKDRWREWKKMPVEASDSGYVDIPNGCAANFESFVNKNDLRKARPDGYYTYVTHRGYTSLQVFPDWGIIVYNFYY